MPGFAEMYGKLTDLERVVVKKGIVSELSAFEVRHSRLLSLFVSSAEPRTRQGPYRSEKCSVRLPPPLSVVLRVRKERSDKRENSDHLASSRESGSEKSKEHEKSQNGGRIVAEAKEKEPMNTVRRKDKADDEELRSLMDLTSATDLNAMTLKRRGNDCVFFFRAPHAHLATDQTRFGTITKRFGKKKGPEFKLVSGSSMQAGFAVMKEVPPPPPLPPPVCLLVSVDVCVSHWGRFSLVVSARRSDACAGRVQVLPSANRRCQHTQCRSRHTRQGIRSLARHTQPEDRYRPPPPSLPPSLSLTSLLSDATSFISNWSRQSGCF